MKISRALLLSGLLLVLFIGCNKKDKLKEDVDPNLVNFLVTQPSIAFAQFAIKCTNYDITLDTISYLSPDNALYIETFNSQNFNKDESFLAGSWDSADGIWILQFRGSLQETGLPFTVSVPYTMTLDNDGEEE